MLNYNQKLMLRRAERRILLLIVTVAGVEDFVVADFVMDLSADFYL
jgi:hypothetical protein